MTGFARVIVLLLRFLSEIGALVAFTMWGFSEAGWFGVLPPIAAAAVWGRWMAPRSASRLDDPRRLIAEIAFFSLAIAAFGAIGADIAAVVFAGIALGTMVLVRVFGEPQSEPGAKPAT
jgi:hypothetical protein